MGLMKSADDVFEIASNASSRQKFIDSVLGHVLTCHLSGIDLIVDEEPRYEN